MSAYILRRILLMLPTLLGIMLLNFTIIQFVPGGPVEQLIAELSGNAVDATSAFSGQGGDIQGKSSEPVSGNDSTSRYRGAQGLSLIHI